MAYWLVYIGALVISAFLGNELLVFSFCFILGIIVGILPALLIMDWLNKQESLNKPFRSDNETKYKSWYFGMTGGSIITILLFIAVYFIGIHQGLSIQAVLKSYVSIIFGLLGVISGIMSTLFFFVAKTVKK